MNPCFLPIDKDFRKKVCASLLEILRTCLAENVPMGRRVTWKLPVANFVKPPVIRLPLGDEDDRLARFAVPRALA
jgi:hypothetical protein